MEGLPQHGNPLHICRTHLFSLYGIGLGIEALQGRVSHLADSLCCVHDQQT